MGDFEIISNFIIDLAVTSKCSYIHEMMLKWLAFVILLTVFQSFVLPEEKRSYRNTSLTLNALLHQGIPPIENEFISHNKMVRFMFKGTWPFETEFMLKRQINGGSKAQNYLENLN